MLFNQLRKDKLPPNLEPKDALELWILFDHLWTKVQEAQYDDEGRKVPMASYYREIYEAMESVVPSFQKAVGQERFDEYLDAIHE